MKNLITHSRSWLCVLLAAALCMTSVYAAEIGPTDDLEAAVAALSPGEELVLRGGLYAFDGNYIHHTNRATVQLANVGAGGLSGGSSGYVDGNPGWIITPGFKSISSETRIPLPPADVQAN